MFSELTQLEEALSFRLTAFLSWTASLVTQITSSFGTGCREKQELLNYATTFFFFLYRINRFVTFTRYSTQYGGHLLCVCYSSISNNLCVLIAPSFFFCTVFKRHYFLVSFQDLIQKISQHAKVILLIGHIDQV